MKATDPDIRKLFERMRTLSWNKGVQIITAKAPPMTPAEIHAANNNPNRYSDYLGMMR